MIAAGRNWRGRATGIPGLALVALLSACGEPPAPDQAPPAAASGVESAATREAGEFGGLLASHTIADLQLMMASGRFSVADLTAHYLQRIESLNDELRAVIRVNPQALDDAARQDAALAGGEALGVLFGVPLLIKDNIETRELPTTAGSLALADNRTGRDAAVVARLRAAGAIVLGKANLSEWANMRSERSSSGWSAVGGQTRNFLDATRTPCGSSSGSAVAVAAGLALAAVGTETDGSIVCPRSR